MEEGYDDIKIMGINGKQYDYSSDTCMLCDCVNGSCYEDRILPWTQDSFDSIYYEYDNEDDCENVNNTHGVCKWYENKIINLNNGQAFNGDVCAPINFWSH